MSGLCDHIAGDFAAIREPDSEMLDAAMRAPMPAQLSACADGQRQWRRACIAAEWRAMIDVLTARHRKEGEA